MKDGVRHYTSARPTQVANLGPVRTIRYSFMERCYACGVNPRVDFGSVRLNTTAFQTEISSAAREFGVDILDRCRHQAGARRSRPVERLAGEEQLVRGAGARALGAAGRRCSCM